MTSYQFTKGLALIVSAITFSSVTAFAKCEIFVDRTACTGKEKESWTKCKGEKSCWNTSDAESSDECSAAAAKACANDRFDITKSKVINAKWSGKELKSKSGNADFCADYANKDKEFNKCK